MKKRLALVMTAVFVPLLLLIAFGLSENSFSLMMEREAERAQLTEGIIAAEVGGAIKDMNYSSLAEAARRYRALYSPQGIELVFIYNGVPLGGAELPNIAYGELLTGGRMAMLDASSRPQLYAIAEPLTRQTTMLALRDVSDLYILRDRTRRSFALYALFGAAAVAGLSLLLAHGFTKPVKRLTKAARAIASGERVGAALPAGRRDELGVLAASFEEMREAVAARETMLRDEADERQALLDALAHELRTPLCSLLGNARLLQRGDIGASERNEVLDGMAREIKRLSDMDAQLMKLMRLPHEQPEAKPVKLYDLLNDTARRLAPQTGGVKLTVRGDEQATINGDAALLSLIADNLTVNAIRASKDGRTVTLLARADGFDIIDEGAGMTEEQLKRAFDPFYKGDKARTRESGGAGLGLSLCRRAAEALGGELALASVIGEGTRASFTASLHSVAYSVTQDALPYAREVI